MTLRDLSRAKLLVSASSPETVAAGLTSLLTQDPVITFD